MSCTRMMKCSSLIIALAGLVLASFFLASCSNGSSHSSPPVSYTIGGTVTNLATGDSLQLHNNGGDTLTVAANGSFTFATKLASGTAYSVTVAAQPSSPAQLCGVTNGGGTATANVTSVQVDCGHNEWTWVGGSGIINQAGIYGTQGTPASTNIPGSRRSSAVWTDSSGNFWLFGGGGYDSVGTRGGLNDLWEYSGGQWTWISGSNLAGQAGSYGTQGTPAATNVPGARGSAASWTDKSGNFWLFGGGGLDSTGTVGQLNDLWEYSGGQWAWVSGFDIANQPGIYGIQGVPAAANVPGARMVAVSWTDASGNFWLFGGLGFDSAGTSGELNDLWKYSGGQWTWMSGSNIVNQAGTYGTLGTAAPGNVPGARDGAVGWTDASGNLWLFGGAFNDLSSGTSSWFNDLWEYSGGQWTWVAGSNAFDQLGSYGTKGVAASSNAPAGKYTAVTWTDKAGNFWLFGGAGPLNATGSSTFPNDLWRYSAGQWTWMSGSDGSNTGGPGNCGTQGAAAPDNVPGSLLGPASWTDQEGNLWLFGGLGPGCAGAGPGTGSWGRLNQLWMYEP